MYSIDALLEKEPTNKEFQSVGKALIAWGLLPKVAKTKFDGVPRETRDPIAGTDTDWIRFVWNQMHRHARSFAEFEQNRLSFITFNFDDIIGESWPAISLKRTNTRSRIYKRSSTRARL